MYLIRLDDASDKMNTANWNRMESLLDKYNVKPIVGIIPNNRDEEFAQYNSDEKFWEKTVNWQNKNWTIALHGYQHIYVTNNGGINPVNKRSEFAGLSLEEQKDKIKKGYNILKNKKINPVVFFAPSHTFDNNTLKALKTETNIRIISDTVANNVYYENGFYFIPQQSGSVRRLPFKIVTFCYHPNTMNDDDFNNLELFIKKYITKFGAFADIRFKKRKKSIYDKLLKKMYFMRRK